MPPSKIRKNLIGLITLAPNIEDNLMEKIDLPLCNLLPLPQKSKMPTPTISSSKRSSTATATLTAPASPTSTTPPLKATLPPLNSAEPKKSPTISSQSILNSTTETPESAVSSSLREKPPTPSAAATLPRRVTPSLPRFRRYRRYALLRQLGLF